MFNSSRRNLLVKSSSIEYFDDQDLSALQFWMLIGTLNEIYLKFTIEIFRNIDFFSHPYINCFNYYHLL